jgi:hypothetical protein
MKSPQYAQAMMRYHLYGELPVSASAQMVYIGLHTAMPTPEDSHEVDLKGYRRTPRYRKETDWANDGNRGYNTVPIRFAPVTEARMSESAEPVPVMAEYWSLSFSENGAPDIIGKIAEPFEVAQGITLTAPPGALVLREF